MTFIFKNEILNPEFILKPKPQQEGHIMSGSSTQTLNPSATQLSQSDTERLIAFLGNGDETATEIAHEICVKAHQIDRRTGFGSSLGTVIKAEHVTGERLVVLFNEVCGGELRNLLVLSACRHHGIGPFDKPVRVEFFDFVWADPLPVFDFDDLLSQVKEKVPAFLIATPRSEDGTADIPPKSKVNVDEETHRIKKKAFCATQYVERVFQGCSNRIGDVGAPLLAYSHLIDSDDPEAKVTCEHLHHLGLKAAQIAQLYDLCGDEIPRRLTNLVALLRAIPNGVELPGYGEVSGDLIFEVIEAGELTTDFAALRAAVADKLPTFDPDFQVPEQE